MRVAKAWAGLTLFQQFISVTIATLGASMIVLGFWVSAKIEKGVVDNTAHVTALYMDSFIGPHLQELENGLEISAPHREAIDELLSKTEIGKRVPSVKIWMPGGTIVYSNREEMIGKSFPEHWKVKSAAKGKITADFDELDEEENEQERSQGSPLLEIYAPIHSIGTGQIIAVAEFYADANTLQDDLTRAKGESWLVVALGTLLTTGLLFSIVRQGSWTIARQRQSLERQVSILSGLLAQNEELRSKIDQAYRKSAEINERFLRRLGAELHDGPAQLISLVLLRLHALAPSGAEALQDPARRTAMETVHTALNDALKEVRNLSAGLGVPELEALSLEETLRTAVRLYGRRTGVSVAVDIGDLPGEFPVSVKTCLYRFVQEGLTNGFRHAAGKGQRVKALTIGGMARVSVEDDGPGFVVEEVTGGTSRLGLAGLRNRVESLGGTFTIRSNPGEGTALVAEFPIRGRHD